jgi:diaminopimelate decarboxylase
MLTSHSYLRDLCMSEAYAPCDRTTGAAPDGPSGPYVKSDILTIEEISLLEVAVGGTPVIVYSIARLHENLSRLKTALDRVWPNNAVHFALKSCYLRPIVSALLDAGAGVEVMSALEHSIAVQAGAHRRQIIATGIGFSESYLEAVTNDETFLIVVDNTVDLRRLSAAAATARVRIRVALRVNPPSLPRERYVMPGSKLGTDWADDQFMDLVTLALSERWLDVVGLHCHVLGRCADEQQFVGLARAVVEIATTIEHLLGKRFQIIDIGGGLDTARSIALTTGLEAILEVLANELLGVGYNFQLVVEPGRFLVADSAVCITSVVADKENSGSIYRIVDATSNVLIPRPGMRYPAVPVVMQDSNTSTWCRVNVADRTCTPTLLTTDVLPPSMEPGDLLALLDVGAYTTVFSELWAFELPRVCVVDGGRLKEIVGKAAHREMWRALYNYNPKF